MRILLLATAALLVGTIPLGFTAALAAALVMGTIPLGFTAALAAALIVGTIPVGATAALAAESHWAPPVPGAPTRLFRLGPDPFARGQHRGVDFAARGVVRAACAGRVVFAGKVAGAGTVSTRCGHWRVSYAPLTHVAVRAGRAVGPGSRLGHAAGGLHFGVRREGRRFGYVDPLRFLAARAPAPPPLVAPPGALRGRPPPGPARASPIRPHAASRAVAPWPVWLGLALLLTGLLGAGKLRLPYRRQEGASCRASSTSSSSPTTPSSP